MLDCHNRSAVAAGTQYRAHRAAAHEQGTVWSRPGYRGGISAGVSENVVPSSEPKSLIGDIIAIEKARGEGLRTPDEYDRSLSPQLTHLARERYAEHLGSADIAVPKHESQSRVRLAVLRGGSFSPATHR